MGAKIMSTISMEQQTYLTTMLNFSQKILLRDDSISEEIALLNSMTYITEDDIHQIEDIIQGGINNLDDITESFLLSVISQLNIIDQSYITAILKLSNINSRDLTKLQQTITEQLLINYSFNSEIKTFTYYKRLSMLAILTRDITLIQNTIAKVESL